MKQLQRGRLVSFRRHQECQRRRSRIRGNAFDCCGRIPARQRRAGDGERARHDAFARHPVDQGALQRVPRRVRTLGPAVLRLDRTPIRMLNRFFVDGGTVSALLSGEKCLVRGQQRAELLVLGR